MDLYTPTGIISSIQQHPRDGSRITHEFVIRYADITGLLRAPQDLHLCFNLDNNESVPVQTILFPIKYLPPILREVGISEISSLEGRRVLGMGRQDPKTRLFRYLDGLVFDYDDRLTCAENDRRTHLVDDGPHSFRLEQDPRVYDAPSSKI